MKSLSLFVALLFASFLSHSQTISIGAQGSYLSLGDGLEPSIGVGLRGEYGLNEKTGVFLTANYYFGDKEEYTTSAYNGSMSPSTIQVGTVEKYKAININLSVKRYLAGDYESSFGGYVFGGAGYMAFPYKVEVDGYDTSYQLDDVPEDETFSNFTLNFGLGLDAELPFGSLFAEGQVNIPANEQNGQQVYVEIPTSVAINLGIRIPIN